MKNSTWKEKDLVDKSWIIYVHQIGQLNHVYKTPEERHQGLRWAVALYMYLNV